MPSTLSGWSVMFRLPPGVDSAAFVAQLREANVFIDCRGSTLRVSPGNVTTLQGVDALARTLRSLL